MNLLKFINKLDAHHRLYISITVAIIAFLGSINSFSVSQHFMITWIAYSLCYLILAWISILSTHPKEIRKTASTQDLSRTLIFIFIVVAAFISLFVVILLLKSTKNLSEQELLIYILLTFISVISSWWTVHTVFAFRYAHLFYGASKENKIKFVGGLEFPKESEPDYLDFIYFSFVVGMTFQVSDVVITSRRIRRIVLAQSLISFVFNTVIVGLTINIIASLIQK
jgi:uncharacterized membrane protein